MKRKILAISLCLCLVVGLLGACGSTSTSKDGGKVIKIGVFEPFTGENGGGGFQEALGMRYANKVYPTIEIAGDTYTIELVEADNKSDKTEAVSAALSLISSDVAVFLGS